MKLEDQVCSLELAKKLKELGVEQKSLFYWTCYDSSFDDEGEDYGNIVHYETPDCHPDWHCSAFTVAELGKMLPKRISFSADKSEELGYSSLELRIEWVGYSGTSHHGEFCSTRVQKCVWNMVYKPFHVVGGTKEDKFIYLKQGNTEASARAQMLIYLIENSLLSPRGEKQ